MIERGLYKFEPGAMSIIQMGEELIGHPTTALGELVKNSYDADAIECKVYIDLNYKKEKSFFIISDDGLGMSENILFGEWLQPSISTKRLGNGKSAVFKRSLLGSKGIGRLAAMALGRYLTVISKTSKEKHYNWIFIDRESFKKEVLLKEIKFPGGKANSVEQILFDDKLLKIKNSIVNESLSELINKKFDKNFSEGTFIILEELDESVDTIMKDDFIDGDSIIEESTFMMALRSLVSPLSLMSNSQEELIEKDIIDKEFYKKQLRDQFNLFFGATIYDKEEFNVENNLLPVNPLTIIQEYDYRIIGKYSKQEGVISNYYCKRLGDKLSYEERVFLSKKYLFSEESLRRRRIQEQEEIPIELLDVDVGDFYFDIRVFDRDPDSLDKLTNMLNQPGRLATRKLLDKLVGFRVSKNGFGVKPYGEEDKDWMGLGQRRVQEPVQVLGPNQILGYVFLFSPENDGLSEKTNREGFYENKAFINLKKIIRTILLDLGRKRAQFRLKNNIGRSVRNYLNRPDTEEYLKFISANTQNSLLISRSKEFVQDITTTLDNMETTLTFSQRLATLGSGLELVYHELSQPISQLGGLNFSMQVNSKKINPESIKNIFIKDLEQVDNSLETLEKLRISLKPAIGLSRRKLFLPFDTYNKVTTLFKKDINDYSIKILAEENIRTYSIKDYEYAIWISFLNILNNAIYWLKPGKSEKIVKLKLDKDNNIVISNNGPKIKEDILDIIFEYGITNKEEKSATGLGLAFTKNILNSYDWDISAENRSFGPTFILKKRKEK